MALLEAQNDAVLEVSLFFKKKNKAPQNNVVLGCSDLKKKNSNPKTTSL